MATTLFILLICNKSLFIHPTLSPTWQPNFPYGRLSHWNSVSHRFNPSELIHILGIHLGSNLSLESQVVSAGRSSYSQFGMVHQLWQFLDYDSMDSVAHALETSHLETTINRYTWGCPWKLSTCAVQWCLSVCSGPTTRGSDSLSPPASYEVLWAPFQISKEYFTPSK